jgi:hypothetical protein
MGSIQVLFRKVTWDRGVLWPQQSVLPFRRSSGWALCVSVPLIAALDSGWPAKFLGVVGLALFCAAMGIVELGLALVLYIISRFR